MRNIIDLKIWVKSVWTDLVAICQNYLELRVLMLKNVWYDLLLWVYGLIENIVHSADHECEYDWFETEQCSVATEMFEIRSEYGELECYWPRGVWVRYQNLSDRLFKKV